MNDKIRNSFIYHAQNISHIINIQMFISFSPDPNSLLMILVLRAPLKTMILLKFKI